MALLMILILIAIPIAELYVGSLVVDQWGFGTALLLLLTGAVLGIIVVRTAWRRRPRGADNALLFLAGLLLIFPGYVTDVLGLLLLLPPVRAVLKVWIGGRVDRALSSWNLTVLQWDDSTGRLRRTDYGSGDVVTGEVVDDDQPPNDTKKPELE